MNDMTQPGLMPWKSTVDESMLPKLPDIPCQRYLDEAFYQLEIKHVFHKVWLLVGHASEYEKAGSYRLLDLDLAPIVVVRGKDGKLRAFRVNDLSGFVARQLSGCHSAPKGARDETDEAATGDTEDEIRRSVFRMERRTSDARLSGSATGDVRA